MSQVDVIMRVVEEVISAAHQCRTSHESGDSWEQFTDERKHYAAKWCALRDMVQQLVDEASPTQTQQQPATHWEPVAWRMQNTAYSGLHYEYYTSKESAEQRQTDFNRSVDDGGLHDLTPLYLELQPTPIHIKAMQMALEALQWYVDEEDVVESMPGNEPWAEGKQRAESAIAALQNALPKE